MFITRGISFLLGKQNSSVIDVNNLPDLDSQDDIVSFLNSIKQVLLD